MFKKKKHEDKPEDRYCRQDIIDAAERMLKKDTLKKKRLKTDHSG